MLVSRSTNENAGSSKVRDCRMQAWEDERFVVCRVLHLTHFLDLELDFSLLFYFLQRGAMDKIPVSDHCFSLIVKLFDEVL
jgi:hypothetical protein